MNIQRAIEFLRPNTKYYFNGDLGYKYLVWPNTSVRPTELEIAGADLPAAKAERISKVKWEASLRIYASYPAYAQSNAALGIYDNLDNTDPWFLANMKQGIQTIINSERAAEGAINALTTSDAVDSFTW
jgi:hypothetical protein